MSLAGILVLSLATWRMASLLSTETGPWDVFLKLRELFGITHDDDKLVQIVPETFMAQVISCVWCNSIYIGAFWTLLWFFLGEAALWIALPFALSAAAIMLEKLR